MTSRNDIPPADPRDKITVTRLGRLYVLTGSYCGARVMAGRSAVDAETIARWLGAFPLAVVDTSQLADDDAILGALVEDPAGDQRPWTAARPAEPTDRDRRAAEIRAGAEPTDDEVMAIARAVGFEVAQGAAQ